MTFPRCCLMVISLLLSLSAIWFVEQSLHDEAHHLAFLGRKLIVTLPISATSGPICTGETIALECVIGSRPGVLNH
jgi:hypothetical protein